MAVAVRGGRAAITGVIMHTDQGSEYTAGTFQTACGRCDITQSMGRVGSALDNAVIESWHSTLEFELRQLEHFATRAQVRRRLASWIEEYNHQRRHSSLGMRCPIDYEFDSTPVTSTRCRSRGHDQPTPPPRQHDAVLAGIKAAP
jgi:putative transposase